MRGGQKFQKPPKVMRRRAGGLHFDLSPHRRAHVPRAVMDRSHHYTAACVLYLWATQHIYALQAVSINSLIKTEAMKSLKLHAPKPQLFRCARGRCIAACSARAAGDVSNLMSAFARSTNFLLGD
jgi:hypothetical protein